MSARLLTVDERAAIAARAAEQYFDATQAALDRRALLAHAAAQDERLEGLRADWHDQAADAAARMDERNEALDAARARIAELEGALRQIAEASWTENAPSMLQRIAHDALPADGGSS